ncbi:hypothetical protein BJF83_20935 [Nocardiopsis sp. CNR-923]|nr:hypothetical protein BJF83_20935 [Nocardiopsis sp. CNR-923]
MNLAELRVAARERGLPVSGAKADLTARLRDTDPQAGTDEEEAFTTGAPALGDADEQTKPLPDAGPEAYSDGTVPPDAHGAVDSPTQEDPSPRGDVAELRSGVVALLDLEQDDPAAHSNTALLELLAARMTADDDNGAFETGRAEGRRETAEAAAREVTNTTGSAGGTLVRRIRALADHDPQA